MEYITANEIATKWLIPSSTPKPIELPRGRRGDSEQSSGKEV